MRTIKIITKAVVLMTALLGLSSTAYAVSATTVGFDGGSDGGFTGNAFFEATDGNPGGSAHFFGPTFGMVLRTGGPGEPVNPAFIGDYSQFAQTTISFDVQVNSITNFFGGQIPVAIGISLIDHDIVGGSGSSGVFLEMGVISQATHGDWTTLTAVISDVLSADLPPGWIGFGEEDPNTFEPVLPDGATFATVLAGVDEFQITTFVPGFFFTNSNFDVRIDNISVNPVPVPAALWLFGAALASLVGFRRQ